MSLIEKVDVRYLWIEPEDLKQTVESIVTDSIIAPDVDIVQITGFKTDEEIRHLMIEVMSAKPQILEVIEDGINYEADLLVGPGYGFYCSMFFGMEDAIIRGQFNLTLDKVRLLIGNVKRKEEIMRAMRKGFYDYGV